MINEDFSTRGRVQDVGRWYVTRFVQSVARDLPTGSSVLDAGAGECVYRRFFSHCDYKSIDLGVGEPQWNYDNLDFVGPLHAMPIDDGVFDSVLCTQVLEHLEWPRESVAEMYRVLKPEGRLYLTVPMAQNEHQVPYDFFRYTSYGLKSICLHAGFRSVEVIPLGGLLARWAYELPRGLTLFPSAGLRSGRPSLPGVALLPLKVAAAGVVRLAQLACLSLDRFDKERNDPWGWACVATK